jgi:uncharacterized membrane protein YbhN (UPF0104 family)
LAISAVLLGGIAWYTDWDKVGQAFAHLGFGWWFAALAAYVLAQAVSTRRWQLLAEPLGFCRPYRQLHGIYYIGMYFNLVLPTSIGGDVVRAWYLDGRRGRRVASFLSVLLDRLSGLAVLLVLAVLGVVLSPVALPAWVRWSVWGAAAAAVGGLLLLPLVARLRVPFAGRARQILHGLAAVRSPRVLLSTTLLSLVVQAVSVVQVWFVSLALGAPVPFAYLWILVPMVSLLTMLPITVGGHGLREVAMVLFLAPLGIGQGTALPLSFLWLSVYVAASLAGGLVYVFGNFPAPTDAVGAPIEGPSDDGPVDRNSDQGRAGQPRAAA